MISLAVDPSAQAAQWAARRTQKAPKAALAAHVSELSSFLVMHILQRVLTMHVEFPHQYYHTDAGSHIFLLLLPCNEPSTDAPYTRLR